MLKGSACSGFDQNAYGTENLDLKVKKHTSGTNSKTWVFIFMRLYCLIGCSHQVKITLNENQIKIPTVLLPDMSLNLLVKLPKTAIKRYFLH